MRDETIEKFWERYFLCGPSQGAITRTRDSIFVHRRVYMLYILIYKLFTCNSVFLIVSDDGVLQ
jgi:hypothetical protein